MPRLKVTLLVSIRKTHSCSYSMTVDSLLSCEEAVDIHKYVLDKIARRVATKQPTIQPALRNNFSPSQEAPTSSASGSRSILPQIASRTPSVPKQRDVEPPPDQRKAPMVPTRRQQSHFTGANGKPPLVPKKVRLDSLPQERAGYLGFVDRYNESK
jgi:hypothetical protein